MKKSKRKKNKIERKIFHSGKLNEMKNAIQIHKNVPLYNIFFENSIKNDINSYCDINIYNVDNIDTNKYQFKNDIIQKINRKTKKPNVLLSCKKIIILPDSKQKKIILNMFEGYRKAYNLTLKFIKTREYRRKKYLLNKNIENEHIENENIESENIETEHIETEHIEIEHIESENIETKHIESENIESENVESEHVETKHIESENSKKTKEEKKKELLEKVDKLRKNNNLITDFSIIRTYFIKNELKYLAKKYKTPVHTLAYAVKLACASYKSALTNLRNGNIRYFNVRYLKQNKNSHIMDIEKTAFSNNSFFSTILGKYIKTKPLYNGVLFNFKSVKNDSKLHYNKKTKRFTLLVPEEYTEHYNKKLKLYEETKDITIDKTLKQRNINKPKNKLLIKKEKYISIDPGLRTFLNCISNDKYIEIGKNMRDNYYKLFKKIDDIEKSEYFKDKNKINNKKTYNIKTKIKRTNKCRNKKENKLYRFYNKININENLDINEKTKLINKCTENLKHKLKNKIHKRIINITSDIHWKIINYLTNHYNHISIGKWSTKSIIKNDKSILNSYNKRFAQSLSFYTLLQRLEFKCRARNISLRIQDEYYTSKVCTNCTYKNDMLGGNEIFNCPSCNISIKRDYNGARNIMLKSLL